MLKRKFIISCALVIILISMVSPAFAWGLNTHVFIGNLILADLKDIGVDIYGDGLGLGVEQDIYTAITKYPEAYRAGTLGPDIFSLALTEIRTPSTFETDKYLNLMYDSYLSLPLNYPQREKIFAFILGYATHKTSDNHVGSLTNLWADGVFPSAEDMLKDPGKLKIAIKHIAVENYIDSVLPDYHKTGLNIKIDAPVEFIKEVIIDEAARKYEVPPYLKAITSLRDELEKKARITNVYKDADMSQSKIDHYGVNIELAGYAYKWQQEIDTALIELVRANQEMEQALIDKNRNTNKILSPIISWANKYSPVMGGSADDLAQTLGFSKESVIELINLMPTQDMKIKLQEFNKAEVFRAYEKASGFSIDEIVHMINNPVNIVNSPYFATGSQSSVLLDKQLKNFGTYNQPEKIEFTPIYNSLQLSKYIFFAGHIGMIKSFDKIDITIKTGENSKDTYEIEKKSNKASKGTDDDIFFVLKLSDGNVYEKLLDLPGYNDFESNATDTYTLELPRYVTFKEIDSVQIKKGNSVNDNWYPDYIIIKTGEGDLLIKSGDSMNNNSFYRVFSGNDIWKSNVGMENIHYGRSNFSPSSMAKFISASKISYPFIDSYKKSIFKDSYFYISTSDVLNTTTSMLFEGASGWAVPELKEAYDLNLITLNTIGNFNANITRAEFAGLAVKLYESLTKDKAIAADFNTFSDTNDLDVLKAYNLKIVNGMGEGLFAPDNLITREQIAVMYYNLIKAAFEKLRIAMPETDGILTIGDKDIVAGWAVKQVDFVFDQDIIKGDGVYFDPKANASREAAIAVVKRVYKKYIDKIPITSR